MCIKFRINFSDKLLFNFLLFIWECKYRTMKVITKVNLSSIFDNAECNGDKMKYFILFTMRENLHKILNNVLFDFLKTILNRAIKL